MKLLPLGLAVSLVVVTSVLLPVDSVSAQHFRGGGGQGGPGRFGPGPSMGSRGFSPNMGSRGFSHKPVGFHRGSNHFGHRHFGRGFGFFGVAGAPYVVYGAPPFGPYYGYDYGGPPYVDPSAYYDPTPIVSAPPTTRVISIQPLAPQSPIPPVPAPPAPSVVEFSTGRYEMRGDGTSTPYVWVWIPNPPSAPPSELASGDGGRPRRPQLYRWTDDQGVLHLTDRWEMVPADQKSKLKPPSS